MSAMVEYLEAKKRRMEMEGIDEGYPQLWGFYWSFFVEKDPERRNYPIYTLFSLAYRVFNADDMMPDELDRPDTLDKLRAHLIFRKAEYISKGWDNNEMMRWFMKGTSFELTYPTFFEGDVIDEAIAIFTEDNKDWASVLCQPYEDAIGQSGASMNFRGTKIAVTYDKELDQHTLTVTEMESGVVVKKIIY